MRPCIIMIAAASLFATTSASSAAVYQMTISNQIQLSNALVALDGQERVIKDNGNEKTVREPYKFTSTVRYTIARNLQKLSAGIEAYNQARQASFRSAADGRPELKPGTPEMAKFQEQDLLLLQKVVPIDLDPISKDDLDLDHNAIPGSVLSVLLTIAELPPLPAYTPGSLQGVPQGGTKEPPK